MVPVGDKKKKKLLVICVTGIVLLILLLLGYPAAKLEVISRHYQVYGSYIILQTHERVVLSRAAAAGFRLYLPR